MIEATWLWVWEEEEIIRFGGETVSSSSASYYSLGPMSPPTLVVKTLEPTLLLLISLPGTCWKGVALLIDPFWKLVASFIIASAKKLPDLVIAQELGRNETAAGFCLLLGRVALHRFLHSTSSSSSFVVIKPIDEIGDKRSVKVGVMGRWTWSISMPSPSSSLFLAFSQTALLRIVNHAVDGPSSIVVATFLIRLWLVQWGITLPHTKAKCG